MDKEKDKNVKVEWVECPSCKGSGYADPPSKWTPDQDGNPAPSIDCSICNGNGGWWEDDGGKK